MPPRPHLPIVPLALALAFVVAGFLALSIVRNAVRNYQLHQEERALRLELEELAADREQLTAVRDYVESDEYIEDVARRVLGLVRPGETLVIVSGTEPEATPTPGDVTAPARSWWEELFVAPAPAPTPESAPADD